MSAYRDIKKYQLSSQTVDIKGNHTDFTPAWDIDQELPLYIPDLQNAGFLHVCNIKSEGPTYFVCNP